MVHDRARHLVPLLADGALGPLRRFFVARHAARCPACAAQLEELQAMRTVIRTKLVVHRAPPGLAARIGGALPKDAPPMPRRPWFRLPALGIAGGGLAGALAGVALTLMVVGQRGADDGTLRSLVNSHVRSLMADHLTDVATSDKHTVRPWLSARLDVSPPVPDLAERGFPLIGGRLDYVDGHRAAAVVYRHAKHVINLFAWSSPGRPVEPMHQTQSQGFNCISWRRDGVTYNVVSDLEADQLLVFVRLVMAE